MAKKLNLEEANTELIEAIRNNEKLPVIKKLIEIHGAQVNCQDCLGQTPLITAMVRGTAYYTPPLVAYLFEKGADPTLRGASELHPLSASIRTEIPRVILMVLHQLGQKNALTQTLLDQALMDAVGSGRSLETAKTLVEAGADVSKVVLSSTSQHLSVAQAYIKEQQGLSMPRGIEQIAADTARFNRGHTRGLSREI